MDEPSLVQRHPFVRFRSGEPELVIECSPWLFVLGVAIGTLSVWLDTPGVVTGLFLVNLGAAGRALENYQSEPGLWRLAGLFLTVGIFLYGLFLLMQLRDLINQAALPPLGTTIDFTIAAALLMVQLKFLYQTGRANWELP